MMRIGERRRYISVLLAVITTSLSAQPRLTFQETMADAGTLSVGKAEKGKVEFVCKNTGNEPLIFQTVETSCPCADVQLPKKPLKPGKETKIKVTFHAKELDERGVVGNIITIFYNGPNRFTRIRVRAELID